MALRTDRQSQHDILVELKKEPCAGRSPIAVEVADGIATLSGVVASVAEKTAAEGAARRISGIRGIANEIDVASPALHDDTELARRIAETLESNVAVPAGRIRVEVERGVVTLTGRVDWRFQVEALHKAAQAVPGTIGIVTSLEVHHPVCADDVRDGIEAAYRRLAELDAKAVKIETDGSKVVLSGRVRSRHERQIADRAAWASPGVTDVQNDILVRS